MRRQSAADARQAWFWAAVVGWIFAVVLAPVFYPQPAWLFALLGAVVLAVVAPLARSSWQAAQLIADDAKPLPSCRMEPVEYDGWSGSIHTFYFANSEFCERFRAANARKLVG
jgi:hypothetical protein